MTCKRDPLFRVALWVAMLLGLTACEQVSEDLPPIEQAQQSLAAGDGIGAEIALRRALETGTPKAEVAAYLGEAELLQGRRAEARRWLARAEFSAATAAHGYHMLGRLEFQDGNLPRAGRWFDRSWRENPDNADLWVDIGRLRFRGGEQAQAIEASRRAVAIDPDNPRALQFRAQLVRDAEGLRAALPWFEAALERNPDDLDLLGDYAATLGDLGRASDALAIIRKMAEIDNRNPRVFYLQAVIVARAGSFDLARTLLGHIGTDMASVPAVMLLSGIVDIENENFESAALTLERLATLQPDNRRVQALLARAIALGMNERELVYRFDKMALSAASSPYMKLTLARAHEVLGARVRAATLLDSAAAGRSGRLAALPARTPLSVASLQADGSGEGTLALVRGWIVAGQPGLAVAPADAFRSRFPGSADALALAGDVQFANAAPARAALLYAKAAKIRETWPLTQRTVAAYSALGRTEAANRLLARRLVADPMNGEASTELARVAISQRAWARAAALLDHAIEHGAARDPTVWMMRSVAAGQMGDRELAFDAAVHAQALQPMRWDTTATLTALAR